MRRMQSAYRFGRAALATLLAMCLFLPASFGVLAGDIGGGTGTVVFAGTDDCDVPLGGSFDALAGVSASDGAGNALAVAVTAISSSAAGYSYTPGDSSFTASSTEGDTYTVTYAAYAAADTQHTTALGTDSRTVTVAPAVSVQGLHSIKWVSGTNTTVIGSDGKSLTITPGRNSESGADAQMVTCQVDYSTGGDRTCAPYDIEIRIPLHVFYDRSGNPCDQFTTALVPYPGSSGASSFNYAIDNATQEIVISNWDTISSARTFSTTISWSFLPSDVADGYRKADISAKYDVSYTDTTTGAAGHYTRASENISLQVETDSTLVSASKHVYQKYERWQDAWGTAPADADDYIYVIWQGYFQIGLYSTQPYYISLSEQAGVDVVGWFAGETSAYSDYYRYNDYRPGGTLKLIAANPQIIAKTTDEYTDGTHTYVKPETTPTKRSGSAFVLCRYKRSDFTAYPTDITNDLTCTLHGIDGALHTLSADAVYTYEGRIPPYPGDEFAITKWWQNTDFSSVNELLAGMDIPAPTTIQITADARGHGLTKVGEDYGRQTYTVEMTDDYLSVNGTRLAPEDYSFTSLRLGRLDEYYLDSIEYTETRNTAYASYSPVKVFVKTAGTAGAWTLSSTVTWAGTQQTITLPQGTYAVKVSYETSKYRVSLSGALSFTLNSTAATRALAQARLDAGYSSMPVRNIDTLAVKKADGSYVVMPESGSNLPSGADRTAIFADDAANYGGTALHAYTDNTLKSYPFNTMSRKCVLSASSDPVRAVETVNYRLLQENYIVHSGRTDLSALRQMHVADEYRSCVFYDLLPQGGYLVAGSVVVGSATNFLSSGSLLTPAAVRTQALDPSMYTVSTVENWRGSGRTMLIVDVDIAAATENYFNLLDSGKYAYGSGLTVDFSMAYPWQSITDYGKTTTNSFMFKSEQGELLSGKDDYGGSSDSARYFSDLDGNGVRDAALLYGYSSNVMTTFNVENISEIGYTKRVRSAEQPSYEYGQSAAVAAAGTYEYQLRLVTQDASYTKGVILYDVLETANEGAPCWKGAFDSADVSYAVGKGIAAKVYYSTLSGIDPHGNARHADLSNTAVWTLTPPADKADVTAVAFDLRYRSDGTNYVFGPKEMVLCSIFMQAPTDVSPYLSPLVYAYNDSLVQAAVWDRTGDEASAVAAMERSNKTTVSLRDTVAIHKRSDPASGTAAVPAVVSANSRLTYTIDLANLNSAQAVRGVVVEDVIPSGLDVLRDQIAVYWGADPAAVVLLSATSSVSLAADGAKLTFTVPEIPAGGELHLVVPTVVREGARYENTARVVKLGVSPVSISSETTYHENDTPQVFSYTAVKSDSENGKAVRPGGRITYTIVVTNTGNATLRGLRVRDYIPAYTHFVSAGAGGVRGAIGGKQHVTWIIDELPVAQSIELQMVVEMNACVPDGIEIRNTAYSERTDPTRPTDINDPNDPVTPTNTVTVTASNPPYPRTDDESKPGFWLAAMLASLCAVLVLRRKPRREE